VTRPLVVKIGGRVAAEPAALLDDIARHDGPLVLVHGGGAAIDELAGQLAVPVTRYESAGGVTSRATDAATLDVVQMALAGRVKPGLVGGLLARGVRAVGLTGMDGGIVRARRKTGLRIRENDRVRVVRGDLTGRIVDVSPVLLTVLLAAGVIPVLSPPVWGEEGPLNVDADRLAARVAAAVDAHTLVVLTDRPGVLRDPADPASVMSTVDSEAGVTGGMRQKLLAGREALDAGVDHVVISDGLRTGPVRAALSGAGTTVGTTS
jgi:acetylglutamate/LysW-gamma-L-alpha-aminoadipate kinase